MGPSARFAFRPTCRQRSLLAERIAAVRRISPHRVDFRLARSPVADDRNVLGVWIKVDGVELGPAGQRLVEAWFAKMGILPIGQA